MSVSQRIPAESLVSTEAPRVGPLQGTLVDAYNTYADPSVGEFLRAVATTARPVADARPTLPAFERATGRDDARRG